MLPVGDSSKGEIEIIKENQVFANKYMEIYNDDVKFPSGNIGTHIRINSGINKSVAVLPVTPEGKIVVIRTYRHAVRGWVVEVPKGSVDAGEPNEAAAKRELEEETGFVCEKLIHLCEYSESPAIFSNLIDCFVAVNCRLIGEVNRENTEAIDKTFEISVEDFLERKFESDCIDELSDLMVYQYCYKKEKWDM